jgi:hypothetical protein
MEHLMYAIPVGAGATVAMDLWGLARKRLLGKPAPDYGLVGRWLGYMPRGRFRHDPIAASAPVAGEKLIGWAAHYLIGVGFASVLLAIGGQEWIRQPTLVPALIVGIVTVAAPFLLMQPGMGAGLAGRRTRNPTSARLQSIVNHAVFGLGLYLAGWIASNFI